MRKKNWIEFNNEQNLNDDSPHEESFINDSAINIYKQRKGKGGKTVTIISGLNSKIDIQPKELLKKLKMYCSTGGKLNEEVIQIQGDMVKSVKEFLRKEGFNI